MKCAIITIGDEILIGQVTDTNAVWISQQLNDLGVLVGEMVTVSDQAGQITRTLDRYLGQYDRVLHCFQEQMEPEEIAYVLNCSQRLVQEYLAIIHEIAEARR